MAHPTRLMILHLLSQSERSVGALEKILGISQANLSQHLNLMKDKDLLSSRRVGNQVYYRLRDNRRWVSWRWSRIYLCQNKNI